MISLRRTLASLAVLCAVTLGLVAGGASPASAAGTCTPSFDYAYGSGYSHIFVHCGGDEVAKVYVGSSGSNYTIYINDEKCDSIGPYWHSWTTTKGQQYLFGAGGCGNTPTYTLAKSAIGTPKNWWVEWGGHNSEARPFP